MLNRFVNRALDRGTTRCSALGQYCYLHRDSQHECSSQSVASKGFLVESGTSHKDGSADDTTLTEIVRSRHRFNYKHLLEELVKEWASVQTNLNKLDPPISALAMVIERRCSNEDENVVQLGRPGPGPTRHHSSL
jgi:hypothetical protein